MMKNQLKQFLIAGAVLAVLAALFFGWRSWYYRPQTLADILPLSPEDIEASSMNCWTCSPVRLIKSPEKILGSRRTPFKSPWTLMRGSFSTPAAATWNSSSPAT